MKAPHSSERTVYPQQPCLAVGAVVFKADQVLLVQRGKPPAKGQWAIPGGSVRLGEPLQRAAEREIREETGAVIEAGEVIYTFDVIDRDDQGRIRYHYIIVDLMAQYIGGDIRPGDDALDVRWVSRETLRRLDVNPRTAELLRKQLGFGPGQH